jgi:DNA-binding NarL/FixJ family response regulator
MPIRLLIADDHEVVRAGVQSVIQETGDIKIVHESKTGSEAVEASKKLKPDVALLDVVMPGGDGLETLARMRHECPDVRVVIYSGYDNPTFLARAMALGAMGFVHKDSKADRLLESVRYAADGKTTWNRERPRRVSPLNPATKEIEVEPPLTQRETEVLDKLTEGLTNKQIAQELEISYETVKEHVQHILRKIGVTDRTQAAVWAVRKWIK